MKKLLMISIIFVLILCSVNAFAFEIMHMDSTSRSTSTPDSSILKIWNDILKTAGLEGSRTELRESNEKYLSSCSFVIEDEIYIDYRKDYFAPYKNNYFNYRMIVTFTLAHELAHIVLGHALSSKTNNEQNVKDEFNADEFAVRIMQKMNADKDAATLAIRTLVPDTLTRVNGYPSKSERIKSIEKQYDAYATATKPLFSNAIGYSMICLIAVLTLALIMVILKLKNTKI